MSGASEPWVALFSVSTSRCSLRRVFGSALGRVGRPHQRAPFLDRASGASSVRTTTWPDDMKAVRLPKNRPFPMHGVENLRVFLGQTDEAQRGYEYESAVLDTLKDPASNT